MIKIITIDHKSLIKELNGLITWCHMHLMADSKQASTSREIQHNAMTIL